MRGLWLRYSGGTTPWPGGADLIINTARACGGVPKRYFSTLITMTSERSFDGIYWDADDLISCKQAAEILFYVHNEPYEVLCGLDFGNLDLELALFEVE